jgi:hypothetical protein
LRFISDVTVISINIHPNTPLAIFASENDNNIYESFSVGVFLISNGVLIPILPLSEMLVEIKKLSIPLQAKRGRKDM